jgi:hypothetical protein
LVDTFGYDQINLTRSGCIHYCEKRASRRIRQSGSVLRKLIRSFVVAGFWSDEANGEKHDLASNR